MLTFGTLLGLSLGLIIGLLFGVLLMLHVTRPERTYYAFRADCVKGVRRGDR
ncbi:hypothetical protein [Micromonospora sp. NPDC048887]|uniref:hypothetical protein n=1 Tax=Micromonospora sp. NPDC048887 TaxID=3155614 RepID=UPI0034077461